MSVIIICYQTCWACKFGNCPGEYHGWAGEDDLEGLTPDERTRVEGQACGCSCVELPAQFDEPELDELPDEHDCNCPDCPKSGDQS